MTEWGSQSLLRDFARCNNDKYRSRPVFIFGRVATCNIFMRDSSRVCQTVQLPGVTTKNSTYFFGWYLMRQCVCQTGSEVATELFPQPAMLDIKKSLWDESLETANDISLSIRLTLVSGIQQFLGSWSNKHPASGLIRLSIHSPSARSSLMSTALARSTFCFKQVNFLLSTSTSPFFELYQFSNRNTMATSYSKAHLMK